MKTVEGSLKLLGNSSWTEKVKTYSVIEIGDHLLQNVRVPVSLDNFLERALRESGTTRLFMSRSLLLGVGLPDGKLYCYKSLPVPLSVLLMGVGLLLTPLFGMGLLLLWPMIGEFRNGLVT